MKISGTAILNFDEMDPENYDYDYKIFSWIMNFVIQINDVNYYYEIFDADYDFPGLPLWYNEGIGTMNYADQANYEIPVSQMITL